MSALDDLIAAVEAGTMHDGHVIRTAIVSQMGGWVVAAFTGDLNAALRLHEEILPGWEWTVGDNEATLWPPNELADEAWCAHGITARDEADIAARAWLLSILRALKAQEAGHE